MCVCVYVRAGRRWGGGGSDVDTGQLSELYGAVTARCPAPSQRVHVPCLGVRAVNMVLNVHRNRTAY